MNSKLYLPLLGFSLLAAIAGLLTLLPVSSASYPSVLGYRALCTYAPASTLFCFAAAGSSCIVRASLVKRRGAVRPLPLAVVSLVLLLAVGSSIWFSVEKSRYVEAASAATSVQSE
ncbi:hypothetical protein [Salinispira pacifica]